MTAKLDLSYAGAMRLAILVVSVAMVAYHIWAIAFGTPEAIYFRGTHLLFVMVLIFFLYRWRGKAEGLPSLLDWALLFAGIAPILYLFINYDYVINRIFYVDELTPMDMIMGTMMTVMVLEATRRVIGLALPLTAIVFLVYGLFIAHLSPMRLIDQMYMTVEGIFGIPLSVSAGYVLIFVLFGSFMERTGTGQLFMDFAMSLTGATAGGPGKVSCVSSALFGTISGSAVANVMVDGPITIPLMKRSGFPPHFAGGVEAVASTGGQIMPPIMGAAAFVMAEFLGVSYGQVVIWAIIPAVLYYVACFAAVHFEAKRRGLVGVPRSELPKLGNVLRQQGHLFLPVLAILFFMYSGFSSPMAALAGVVACFPVAALRKSTRHYVTLENIIMACVDGARNALPVAAACAAAGVVIAVVTLSGLGIVFTQFVVHLSQDYLVLALIFTMMAGIVLGMGMPTTPAYIIMTALLVPAIVKLGVELPAAHMFAFYFAVLSAITPPVALAVFAAAGIAKSDIWKTGLAAVRIAATSFIVPFMFVYEPALLMIGDWGKILWSSATAAVGVLIFAAGLHGYFLVHSKLWQSAALTVAGVLLITPGLGTDVIGAAIAAVVFATQYLTRRAARPLAAE
ncbi:MAG TPA: TRAP transporter permease [Xanthobacteraceae bacterium]|nr:TRAP transporter permease [Xanthobacteraceae bacterium]